MYELKMMKLVTIKFLFLLSVKEKGLTTQSHLNKTSILIISCLYCLYKQKLIPLYNLKERIYNI